MVGIKMFSYQAGLPPFQPLPLATSQLQTIHNHVLNLREPLDSSSLTLSLLLKDKKCRTMSVSRVGDGMAQEDGDPSVWP